MRERARRTGSRLTAAALAIALVALAACARTGPPPIARGTRCDACGMEIQNLRFACERSVDGTWRRYDAIECMLSDMRQAPGQAAWLADYDEARLAPAESLWVVKGDVPSPMGGGYAAFMARASADSIAAATHGRVARLTEFASAEQAP
jgi:nitrous oxide reductase accessory protein NosL